MHKTIGAAGRMETWRLAAFASPCVPVAAMLMPVTVYLPNYYATDLGVSLSAIAFAFGAVRLFDLWLDPTLGFLIDKTDTRFGRFRPWLMAGLPMAVLAVWMLFMARPGIDGAYILFWLIVGFLGQSMASMAHVTWAARIASDYHERSRVFAWWQAFTVMGMLVVLAMPPLAQLLLGLDHAAGVRAIGWFVLAALPLAIGLAIFSTPEPQSPPPARPPHWRQFLALVRRPSVLRLLGTDILLNTGPVIAGTLFFFYFEAVRGLGRAEAGLLLLVYFGGALAGASIWTRLGQAFGKHRALAIGAIAYAMVQAAVPLAPHGLVWSVPIMFAAGLPFAAGPILLRAMMADVADEERLASGVDRSGLLFGLLSGVIKIGSALSVFLSVMLLDWIGFAPELGARNDARALWGLTAAFSIAPAALGVASALLIRGHRLDAAAHAVIRRQLSERDAALAGGERDV